MAGYGRLESLEIDPRLLRRGTGAIADHVIEAVALGGAQHRGQR
ncbi:hypothetical protein ACPXB5_00590 [Micromonospora arida]